MPKGYVIANVDVTDPEQYAQYRPLSTKAMEAYGGKVLVRGGQSETLEGNFHARTIVIEFADLETARRFYHSAEYEVARQTRAGAAQMNLMIVEGV
jgi:uncharacterized protein (DUF1330 family)